MDITEQMATEREIMMLLHGTERIGMPRMVNFLSNESDFFSAPASTKHHLAHRGGLAEHSLSVYYAMIKLANVFGVKGVSGTEITTVALLHDLCKTNYYIEWQTREVNSFGGVDYSIVWKVDDELPIGHGEKSLYLVSKYLDPTDAEAAAIRWHMGAWTPGVVGDSRTFNAAVKKYPLLTLLISADLVSSRLMEDGTIPLTTGL